MFAAVERVRLRVGDRRLVQYPTDLRHWRERRILSTADEEEAAQAAGSGLVAVLTLDWDTYPMSENELPFSDGLSDGRQRSHSRSELQKYRALGRKLLTEFSIEVTGEDGQLLPAGTFFDSLQRGQVSTGACLIPLRDLCSSSCIWMLWSHLHVVFILLANPETLPLPLLHSPMVSEAGMGFSDFTAELGRRQTPNKAQQCRPR